MEKRQYQFEELKKFIEINLSVAQERNNILSKAIDALLAKK